jgi:hypothetical protein
MKMKASRNLGLITKKKGGAWSMNEKKTSRALNPATDAI